MCDEDSDRRPRFFRGVHEHCVELRVSCPVEYYICRQSAADDNYGIGKMRTKEVSRFVVSEPTQGLWAMTYISDTIDVQHVYFTSG